MSEINLQNLNEDIKLFPQVTPITEDMKETFEGVSKLVLLDRYTFKDTERKTLREGDFVVVTVKPDPQFPARGYGNVFEIDGDEVTVRIDEQFQGMAGKEFLELTKSQVDKPLEVYYEQIADRVARGLSEVESTEELQKLWQAKFKQEIESKRFVPAGRVLYGAGSGAEVTLFNCFVQPMPKDSRDGIANHRAEVMNIMSRGGGKQVSC